MENQLAKIPSGSLVTQAAWPPELVLDIALEAFSLEELLLRYDTTEFALQKLYENAHFRRELINTKSDLMESGGKFRSAARMQAEAYLVHMHTLMESPVVAPQTKVSIWQAMVKYAELEPRPAAKDAGSTGTTFNVQIIV